MKTALGWFIGIVCFALLLLCVDVVSDHECHEIYRVTITFIDGSTIVHENVGWFDTNEEYSGLLSGGTPATEMTLGYQGWNKRSDDIARYVLSSIRSYKKEVTGYWGKKCSKTKAER